MNGGTKSYCSFVESTIQYIAFVVVLMNCNPRLPYLPPDEVANQFHDQTLFSGFTIRTSSEKSSSNSKNCTNTLPRTSLVPSTSHTFFIPSISVIFIAMDQIIEDVNKLKKVCDNVGFYFDELNLPLKCLIIRMSLDTSFLEKYTAKQVL